MKRVWFDSDSLIPDEEFLKDLKDHGYEVVTGKTYQDADPLETLRVTEDPLVFAKDPKCLAAIRREEDMKDFPGAKYFVLDVFENEADYFLKIWQRLNGLPWTVGETDRLILRETTEEDFEELKKLYDDPSMTEFNEPLYEDEDEKQYIRDYREQVYAIQGFGIWSVIRKEDGKLIGRAGLTSRPEYDGIETGFALGAEYRGQGYAREAVRECLRIARKMDFREIRALVMPGNEASIRLLEALCFSKKGSMRHHGTPYEIWEIVLR